MGKIPCQEGAGIQEVQEAGMDSGLAIRPVAGAAEAAYGRPEVQPVRAAVPTVLPPSNTVTAASDTASAGGYDSGRDAAAQQRARQFVLDPQTREVIFRVIDVRTGEVDQQVPDAALLRVRAYVRAMAKGESLLEAEAGTDRAV